jgi:dipeptidyl aminopeptidase/acylaminoacyl peptidase
MLSQIARILEELISAHPYFLLGVDSRGRVIYQSNEGGFNSIWALDPSSGDRKRLSTETILWTDLVSDKRNRVVFTRDVSRGREQQIVGYVDLVSDREYLYESMKPLRVFGLADDGERIVFTGATETDISIYMASGDEVSKLHRLDALAFVSDIKGDLVVGSGHLKKNPFSTEIFVYNIGSGVLRVYTPRDGSTNSNPLILSSKKILFTTDAFGGRNRLALLDPETGEITEAQFKEKDLENYNATEYIFYREFNNQIYVVGKREGRSRLFVDGKLLETPEGMILSVYPDKDKIYFTYTSLTKPPRIMVWEGGSLREVIGSRFSRDLEERFGSVEFRYIESLDKLRIPTYIVRSNKFDETRSAVVYIHGGPWSEVADSWSVMIASLVAMGFNVVAPNFRGSTGYGEEFRKLDIGDPGGGDLLDIEASAKYALENKLGEKLFVMGYSYGGYMTLWTMFNKPDLFDCGVAGASVADWEEMYELSDAVFRSFIDTLFAYKKELLKERSPIHKAENLKKPLCIIHPQNDTRTPLKPVMKLISKLMESGKVFEAHIVPDMGHVISNIDDAVKILLPALIFLNRCVREAKK